METTKPYFVDKTGMLGELFPLMEQGSNYICLTRPRRFGKTMAAEMIAAFFSKAQSASDVFDRLLVEDDDGLILELKVDDTPQNAIRQIREKEYALRFAPRLGEKP